jgi:hypothetical protein
MQLVFKEHTARLSSVNPRAECHGEDKALGADIKLEIKTTNDVLSEIHPSLKGSFFRKDDTQGELLDDNPGHMPLLRFPEIKSPIKWDWDSAGYAFRVHIGMSGIPDINILDCKIGKLQFEAINGGSISLGLRLQCNPSPEQMGRLCELIQQDITMTLTPPDVEPDTNSDDEGMF